MALLAKRARGQTVRGLVIGPDLSTISPECHLHQLATVIAARLCEEQEAGKKKKKLVYGVFVSAWEVGRPHRNSNLSPLSTCHTP